MRNICKHLSLFLIVTILASCSNKQSSEQIQLKVMSFNIWLGGGKSKEATASVIVKSGADIIGIQESMNGDVNVAVLLADSLGFHSYVHKESRTIISQYPIKQTSKNGYGVKLKVDDKHFVWMFNIHLMHCPYEPYQLNGIEYCGAPLLNTAEEAVASAIKTRGEEVKEILEDILAASKDGLPIFLTGDFNEPSYLDWTKHAAENGLCKMAVEWPTTKSFSESAGMKDSYRIIHPNEVVKPGHTWTSIHAPLPYEEVYDRIDFVLYKGNSVEVVNSEIVGEGAPACDIVIEDYPSDHRAVLSSFRIK